MTGKTVSLREIARRDVEHALAWYAAEADEKTALRFVDALEHSFGAIARNPAAGSPRYGLELNLPGLSTRPLGRLLYLVFYIERGDVIDVWRILHARRDIPQSLQDPDSA